MAYVAPGYPRQMASEDDGYYVQYTGYQGVAPPSEGEQHLHPQEQELAWYYHQQQQHQLYLQQQQWEEQRRQIHFQAQSGYQADDYYDEETAIKSEAIEAAYDQFYDDFMRAGPSAPSPPRRGSSALAPITIQDDYEDSESTHPYQDYHQAHQRTSQEHQHEQQPGAVPSRPPPRTHHSLPMAAFSSSAIASSSSSSSLDPRVVRSERSTPLAADSGLSAKLGVKLKRGREPRTGQEGLPETGGRGLAAQGEEHEMKLNDIDSGRYSDHAQGSGGWPGQASAFDHDNYDEGPVSPSTSTVATLNPTPTRKKPGRPRGWRELASINPTPLPLTPKKLRNGRVRDRSQESSASGSSSSGEDEVDDRQKEVCHEVYRPQYRLARPYRRRVPGADANAEKSRKARPAKERSLKTSPPADSAEETAPSPPTQLAITPAWTKPWILSQHEDDEEDDAVPSYPEVHYFVRWMHDAYYARKSNGDQRELMEQWGLSSIPPNSQEEATKQRSAAREESRAVEASSSSKKRDAQDDEDDAAVACLLFSDETERPAEEKLEASSAPPIASPTLAHPTTAHAIGATSTSATTTASPSPPPAPPALPAKTSPDTRFPLWLATIATRISILDTPETLLPANARGTPQDYPLLLREQFNVRAGAGASRGVESQGVASQGGKQAEEQPAGAAAAAVVGPSPLEDLHRVSVALPLSAPGLEGRRRRRGAAGGGGWPTSLETKPLWENFVACYRSKRTEGCSHEEALWCGPALPCPLPLRAEGEVQREEEGQEGQELKRDRAPLILRRNLPRAVRGREREMEREGEQLPRRD